MCKEKYSHKKNGKDYIYLATKNFALVELTEKFNNVMRAKNKRE